MILKKIAVITGVTGQDGMYLAKLLLDKQYTVIGIVRSLSQVDYFGFEYLNIRDKIIFETCDLQDMSQIIILLKKYAPDEIYNLAAQSSVGISFSQPIGTIQFNVISVLNLLEAIKILELQTRYYQASSSEMYGKVNGLPITEITPMHPLSPYAISKASAHWITTNYREAYHLFACCGILFNHESFLRRRSFFVKKVIAEAVEIKMGKRQRLLVGNINQKRDFGYAPKYVEAIWLMMQQETPSDYIICSGQSLSLKSIVEHVFKELELPIDRMEIATSFMRPTEIKDIYGDNAKVKSQLGWEYNYKFTDVLDILLKEELNYTTKN